MKRAGNGTYAEKDVQRFWSKVEKRGEDECWPWIAKAVNQDGRGVFRFNYQTISAPRFAYLITYGEPPVGLDIAHTCDNPDCCNPRHLEAISYLENVQDRVLRGHSGHGGSPLTEGNVREIRQKWASKEVTRRQLAEEFSVTVQTIYNITERKTWKSIG